VTGVQTCALPIYLKGIFFGPRASRPSQALYAMMMYELAEEQMHSRSFFNDARY